MADSYWFHYAEEAIALTERIAPYGIYFFEEPLPQYQSTAWPACRTLVPSASPSVSGSTRRRSTACSPSGARSTCSSRTPR